MSVKAKQHVDCACTKIQQDEHCIAGYPSLLCEICDGKGVVPYVKLDGPELWEIVFGIANEVAHEINDEQYTKIADAINSVFIDTKPSPREQIPSDATDEMVEAALAVDWNNENERATVHNIWHAMTAKLPVPSQSPRAQVLEDEIVKHANKTVTLGGQNYKAILLEDVLSVVRAFSSQSMDVTFPQHEEEPTKWQWWAGRDEEWCTIGPCESKEEVIQLAIDERVGEFLSDDGKWYVAVHVIEAQQEPVKLSDYILDADRLLQSAEESLAESDRASAEYDDGPYFDATGDQISDLDKRIKAACDAWQCSNGLKFVPSTFSASRNREHIVVEIEGGDE